MIYSLRCEVYSVVFKLKELGFPQQNLYSSGAYMDEQGFIFFGDEYMENEKLSYVPIYSEILDWLLEENLLNLCIFRKETGWWFYVQSSLDGELLRAGKFEDEIEAFKSGIDAALELIEQKKNGATKLEDVNP